MNERLNTYAEMGEQKKPGLSLLLAKAKREVRGSWDTQWLQDKISLDALEKPRSLWNDFPQSFFTTAISSSIEALENEGFSMV